MFSSDSEFGRGTEKQPSLEDKLGSVTLQPLSIDSKKPNDHHEEEEDYDDEEDDDDDDDDDEWDWKGSPGGDFTKRYAAMRMGNNQQVFSRYIPLKVRTTAPVRS